MKLPNSTSKAKRHSWRNDLIFKVMVPVALVGALLAATLSSGDEPVEGSSEQPTEPQPELTPYEKDRVRLDALVAERDAIYKNFVDNLPEDADMQEVDAWHEAWKVNGADLDREINDALEQLRSHDFREVLEHDERLQRMEPALRDAYLLEAELMDEKRRGIVDPKREELLFELGLTINALQPEPSRSEKAMMRATKMMRDNVELLNHISPMPDPSEIELAKKGENKEPIGMSRAYLQKLSELQSQPMSRDDRQLALAEWIISEGESLGLTAPPEQ